MKDMKLKDLEPEILSRLPAMSLLRLRGVCKPWKMVTADGDFAQLHLSRFVDRSPPLLLVVHSRRKYSLMCAESLEIKANLDWVGAEMNPIVSACDGLFVLRLTRRNAAGEPLEAEERFAVWNPSIRKTLEFPPCPDLSYRLQPSSSPDISSSQESSLDISYPQELGLGFDCSIKDYKYVRYGSINCAVYTFKKNSWRTFATQWSLDPCDCSHGYVGVEKTVCFRGYLVTPATLVPPKDNLSRILVMFNLRDEVYVSANLPGAAPNNVFEADCFDGLTIADGIGVTSNLQLVRILDRNLTVWDLEGELGTHVNWIQRCTFALENPNGNNFLSRKFLHLNNKGVILFTGTYTVDTETRVETYDRVTKRLFEAWPYKECLTLV